MRDSKQTLSESSFILIVSTVLVKIIGAIFKIPLATDSFLGDLGFGYFSVAHDLFMPFYVLAISGLPVAVSHITAEFLTKKYYGQLKENFYKTKKLFLILGLAFSVLICLLSVPLVVIGDFGVNTFYSIIAVVPSIFLCFVISVYRGYFEGFSNMYPTAVSKVIEAVVKLVLGLLLSFVVIKKTGNPALASGAAMLALSLGTLFATLYLQFKFKRKNPLNKLEDELAKKEENLTLKAILILAIPFALASLASSLVALIDVFAVKLPIANANEGYLQILSGQYGIHSTDVSTYIYGMRSKAFTLFNLIPTVTMSLGIGALPVLTECWVLKDKKSFKLNTDYTLKLVSTVTFPAAIGLTLLAKQIMNLLFGSDSLLSTNMLSIYGLAAVFAGFAIPLTSLLQSMDFYYKALKHIIIGLIIKIVSALALVSVPSVNIISAPLSTLICYVYIAVTFVVILKREVGLLDFKNAFLKPFVAAVICGICAYLICLISASKLIILLSILVGVIVYFAVLLLSGAFSKEEISKFPVIKKIFH